MINLIKKRYLIYNVCHKVIHSLRVVSNSTSDHRSMEQLQRWLDGDSLDYLSTPLFVPSSTLLSTPTAIMCAPSAVVTQV